MQLGKKQENRQGGKEVTYKRTPEPDWRIVCTDYECVLPYGKFKGMSLTDLRDEGEEWYLKWIHENRIIVEWGLLKKRGEPPKKPTGHLTASGERWIDIRLVDNFCSPSPFLND